MRLAILCCVLIALAAALASVLSASAVPSDPPPQLDGTWRQIPAQDGKVAVWDLPSEVTISGHAITGTGFVRDWTLVQPIPGAYGAEWAWADGERRACRIERVDDRILFWTGDVPRVYRKSP